MPDSKDGSAHLDGLAQDAPDAPREHSEPSATHEWDAAHEAAAIAAGHPGVAPYEHKQVGDRAVTTCKVCGYSVSGPLIRRPPYGRPWHPLTAPRYDHLFHEPADAPSLPDA